MVISAGVEQGRTVSRLALITAIITWLRVISLFIFFAFGGPFGFLNDVANGLVGLLSLALSWFWVLTGEVDGARWLLLWPPWERSSW